MKHFIIEIIYKVPFEKISEIVPEHRTYLNEGYENGMLLMSGPKNPKTGGILIARAKDISEIENFLDKDPFHIHDVVEYRITEFTPVKHQEFVKTWLE